MRAEEFPHTVDITSPLLSLDDASPHWSAELEHCRIVGTS